MKCNGPASLRPQTAAVASDPRRPTLGPRGSGATAAEIESSTGMGGTEGDRRARRRALARLAIVLVLAKSTWFSATAIVPQLVSDWDLDPSTAAWLTIAVQLGFVAGAAVSSTLALADVIPSNLVIVAGAVGAAAANVLLIGADGVAWAIPVRFATGFFIAGVYAPALKLVATWFARRRGAALGLAVGALSIGSAVPHLVNGLGGLEWKLVVYGTSLLAVAGGLLAAGAREGPYPFPRARFDARQVREIAAHRGVRLAAGGYVFHMWELYAMWTWFLVFLDASMRARGEHPGTLAAYATFFVVALGGAGCWLGGYLGDRWGRARVAGVMLSLSAACCCVIGLLFGAPTWTVVAVGIFWGVTAVADSVQYSTLVTELAPAAHVGTALTMQMAAGFALTCVTIWLVPVVQSAVGWRWAFLVLVPGPVSGIVAMRRLMRMAPEHDAADP